MCLVCNEADTHQARAVYFCSLMVLAFGLFLGIKICFFPYLLDAVLFV